MNRSNVIARFVVTVEQIDGAFKVYCVGPDRQPVDSMGSNPQWPIDAIAGHMLAVVNRKMDTVPTVPHYAIENFYEHLSSGGGEK